MNPSSRKNKQLLKQYPFLTQILAANMEPYGSLRKSEEETWGNEDMLTRVDDLTIKVEKSDGDLMYRRARNIGLGDYAFSFITGGSRKGQVMRRGEYLFAIDHDGNLINRLNWPRNDQERRDEDHETYGYEVLWSDQGPSRINPKLRSIKTLYDKVKHLVWVTVEAWHMDTKDDDQPGSRFGEFVDRTVRITIYNKPDEGFEKLQQDASVYTNLRLDTSVMTRGAVRQDTKILRIDGMLHELCVMFQDEVYFNGMKDVLDDGEVRGASGQFGSVSVLCTELCGYDRVMIEDPVSYVTFQLRPGSQHMYVLGQQGTLPQIRNLVRTVVKMWGERPDLREAFKPDREVSVI